MTLKELIITFLVISSGACYSQSMKEPWVEPLLEAQIPAFFDIKYMESYHFIGHKERPTLSLSDKNFNEKQLESPYNLIAAYISADNEEWYQALHENPAEASLKKDHLEYRKSRKFKKQFTCEIYSELKFSIEGIDYHMLMVYQNILPSEKVCLPIVCRKMPNGEWKICTDKELLELSGFLYIEPFVFSMLISRNNFFNPLEAHPYYQSGIFFTNKGFFKKAFLNKSSVGKLEKYVIDKYNPQKLKDQIDQETHINYQISEIGIAAPASNRMGGLYKYKNNKKEVLERFVRARQSVYNKTPEMALASWVFEHDKDSLLQHSNGLSLESLPSKKIWKNELNEGRLKFLYKFSFNYHDTAYALIYFDQYKAIVDSKGYSRERYYGERRMLVKHIEGNWVLDFAPNSYVQDMMYVTDRLNFQFWSDYFSNKEMVFEKDPYYLSHIDLDNRDVITFPDIKSKFMVWPRPEKYKKGGKLIR